MRARFGSRLPAAKLAAGLLILAVAVAIGQAVGAAPARASHGAGVNPAIPAALRPVPVSASIASAGTGLGVADADVVAHAARVAAKAPGCQRTAAVAAEAGRHVTRPQLVVHHHAALALAGKRVAISGQLRDACAGVRVDLQRRTAHGWQALQSARVGRHGRFALAYHAPAAGTAGLRVAFGGGHGLRAATRSAGDVTAMHPAVASWYYDDTGATGCGFQATYGVANKTLPCGTKVTLSYHGRTVVATVDDRGPYVAGREYDLGINTRNALGMSGVVTLLASS